jgi:hypothetical protein
VITIGQSDGMNALHVSISRVTITGGLNDSEPSGSVVAAGASGYRKRSVRRSRSATA